MGRRRTACGICASIKAKCSKETPCKRCERLSLQCTYDGTASRTEINGVRKTGKVWHTRSTSGCTTCRVKRRKCDETRPVCGTCERLKVPCVSVGPSWPEASNTSPSESHQMFAESVTSQTLEHTSSTSSRPETTRSDDDAAAFQSSSHFLDWIALLGHDEHVEWVRSGNLANSTALAKLPMPCTPDDDAGLDAYLPPTALNNLTGITPATLRSWKVAERHLLNHFLQSVSRALVVVDDTDNPFLSVIVPLALENTTVKHALLALSACHLSQVYPEWGKDVLDHRSRALECLKDEIEDLEHVLWSLAATLLMCLLEICEGQSKFWLLHLHGAYALLEKSLDHHETDNHLAMLIDTYDYICCMASLTCDKVPATFLLQSRGDREDEGLKIHPLYGLSATLYKCLGHCNHLSNRLHCRESMTSRDETDEEAKNIELALQSWSPLEDPSLSRQITEARAAAFATQWAIIMRLQQVTQPTINDNKQVKKATDNILSALSLIRPGSEVEAHILFPLFMAGIGSNTKVNRLTVEYRINVMETILGFRNIVLAHRLLDDIWRCSNEGISVNWEHLMREKYPNLVFF